MNFQPPQDDRRRGLFHAMPAGHPEKVGFPAPLLGESPLRLDLLAHQSGLAFLLKPPGVIAARSRWEDTPCNIETALRLQLEAGKPELERLGIGCGRVLLPLEPEVSGILPVIADPDAVAFWTNAWGSEQLELTFHLCTATSPGDPERTCDLPVAIHTETGFSLISHKTGKKTLTRFRRLCANSCGEIWEASTRFLRRDQIRLHAAESGLLVFGEDRYLARTESPVPAPSRDDLAPPRRRSAPSASDPVYPYPHLHLAAVRIIDPEATASTIEAPLPGKLQFVADRIRAAGTR